MIELAIRFSINILVCQVRTTRYNTIDTTLEAGLEKQGVILLGIRH